MIVFFWREIGVPRIPRSHRLNFCHVSSSVFKIAQSLFFWELIFCLFCYSYTGIRIDGIVPKERALRGTNRMSLTVRSFGTIPEREHTEENPDAFFWVTFQFQNERNTVLVIPSPKASSYAAVFSVAPPLSPYKRLLKRAPHSIFLSYSRMSVASHAAVFSVAPPLYFELFAHFLERQTELRRVYHINEIWRERSRSAFQF